MPKSLLGLVTYGVSTVFSNSVVGFRCIRQSSPRITPARRVANCATWTWSKSRFQHGICGIDSGTLANLLWCSESGFRELRPESLFLRRKIAAPKFPSYLFAGKTEDLEKTVTLWVPFLQPYRKYLNRYIPCTGFLGDRPTPVAS